MLWEQRWKKDFQKFTAQLNQQTEDVNRLLIFKNKTEQESLQTNKNNAYSKDGLDILAKGLKDFDLLHDELEVDSLYIPTEALFMNVKGGQLLQPKDSTTNIQT